MTDNRTADRSATSAAAGQTDVLARWAAGLRWDDVPDPVGRRLSLVLLDTLAVTLAGARTEGQRRIRAVWPQPPGGSPVLGPGTLTQVDTAAYLNATALVCCELDEGGKYARGHPAGHAFPAILALAADLGSSGELTARALLVGYEVAARFGRATLLRPGTHPHGNWGVPGAAAGCALLLGLPVGQLAAAIDTGAGLPVAGHFDSALDGHRVRDAWVGATATSGLAAARLAAAGVVRNTGTAALSLGRLLGDFDADVLTADLGTRWQIEANYFKRHASCSYTHPAADLALELRGRHLEGLTPRQIVDRVGELAVATHALAAPLERTTWDSSLAAMFSVPYAVAAALLYGEITPAMAEATEELRPELFALARKVTVREAPDLTALLPHQRATRLDALLGDGQRIGLSAPHPVGDSSHHPFSEETLSAVLAQLLGDRALVDRMRHAASELPDSPDTGALFRSASPAGPSSVTAASGGNT